MLLDSNDNAVTVFLQQWITVEETAGSYKMLLETYHKRMYISETFEDKNLHKILGKKGHTPTMQLKNLMNHKKLAPMIL